MLNVTQINLSNVMFQDCLKQMINEISLKDQLPFKAPFFCATVLARNRKE